MDDFLKLTFEWLATGVEVIASIIIALAVIEAAWAAFVLFERRDSPADSKEAIRLRLGRWLAVSLEFELGADILRTAIKPSWSEIGQLAAIAALRTLLNYFLQKEIERAAAHNPTISTSDNAINPDEAKVRTAKRTSTILDRINSVRKPNLEGWFCCDNKRFGG